MMKLFDEIKSSASQIYQVLNQGEVEKKRFTDPNEKL